MPELRCSVDTCAHNKQFYCQLDSINVGGSEAKKPQETCCESFKERSETGYTNKMDESTPSPLSNICCEACDCVYNNDKRCEAGKISVEGHSACDCKETECASFRCS